MRNIPKVDEITGIIILKILTFPPLIYLDIADDNFFGPRKKPV